MIVDASQIPESGPPQAAVTIIGAGSAGVVLALELARAGVDVNLIESGGPRYSPRVQALADADVGPQHPPMTECTRRQIGGTSVIWGGRVVPFDPVDFDARAYLPNSRWPIGYADVSRHHAAASAYLRCGRPEFSTFDLPGTAQKSIVPGLPDGDVLTSTLERWSVMNFGAVYRGDLESSPRIRLIHGLTCTEVVERAGDRRRVELVRARTIDGRMVTLRGGLFVLACGGLNATRLLLNSDARTPGGIGNHSGLLGRFYTGHITGRIAEVRFSTPPAQTVFGFDRDAEGVYARRRFSFTREFLNARGLPNIVAWLANAEISDPAHGNGILSFAYLILRSPIGKHLASEAIRKATIKGDVQGRTTRHVLNMVRDLPRTAYFIPTFGYKRFLASRKVPGFFQPSQSNVYTLHYAGEQAPNPDSRVTLTDARDELGMRRIRIDHRYTPADVRTVIEAHREWDNHLRRHGKGELRYVVEDLEASILKQAGDGYHQIGTTRMAERAEDGVVDPFGRVHGFDDLYIASSSTFVTASQANSMFMILVWALRVAEHLRGRLAKP